jgi:hypothetical protein
MHTTEAKAFTKSAAVSRAHTTAGSVRRPSTHRLPGREIIRNHRHLLAAGERAFVGDLASREQNLFGVFNMLYPTLMGSHS